MKKSILLFLSLFFLSNFLFGQFYISEINYLASNNSPNCDYTTNDCRGIEITGSQNQSLAGWKLIIYACNSIEVLAEKHLNSSTGSTGSVWYNMPQLNGGNTDEGGRVELIDNQNNIVDSATFGGCEEVNVPNAGTQSNGNCSVQAFQDPTDVTGVMLWLLGTPTPGISNGNEPAVCGTSLETEFINFTATATKSGITLNWLTASEANNSHFILERSNDAKKYISITEIAGAGSSSQVSKYTYTDEEANTGINYYRLVQVDYSGLSTVKSLLSVHTTNEATTLLVFPNPAHDVLKVLLPKAYEATTTTEIYNTVGQLMQTQQIAAETIQTHLNIEQLPVGNYYLRLVNGNEIQSQRFIKK